MSAPVDYTRPILIFYNKYKLDTRPKHHNTPLHKDIQSHTTKACRERPAARHKLEVFRRRRQMSTGFICAVQRIEASSLSLRRHRRKVRILSGRTNVEEEGSKDASEVYKNKTDGLVALSMQIRKAGTRANTARTSRTWWGARLSGS